MTTATASRPGPTEYDPYYGKFISLLPEGDVLELLERQIQETVGLLGGFGEARGDSRYAPGKWSVKDVAGHLADTERVFVYRALRFARNDRTPLPGFDQDDWVRGAHFAARTLTDLSEELQLVRGATLAFFRGLGEEEMSRRGIANSAEVTVRAIPYIIAGHERHHIGVLRDKYV